MKYIARDCEACAQAVYEQVAELCHHVEMDGESTLCARMTICFDGNEIEFKPIGDWTPTDKVWDSIDKIVTTFRQE